MQGGEEKGEQLRLCGCQESQSLALELPFLRIFEKEKEKLCVFINSLLYYRLELLYIYHQRF